MIQDIIDFFSKPETIQSGGNRTKKSQKNKEIKLKKNTKCSKKNRISLKQKKESIKKTKTVKNKVHNGGGDVLAYRIYDIDDETIVKTKDRCMCIDYKMEGGKFSLKHNHNGHRCKNKVKKGTDFCPLHQKCNSFLRQYLSGYEPAYDTKLWNHPYIEGSHNCYAYFLNDVVDSTVEKCEEMCLTKHKKGCPKKMSECRDLIPQPEDFHLLRRDGDLKKKIRKYYCPTMEKKILSDNKMIKPVKFTEKCPKNHYKGAMVVDPNHTFHFYRQNPNGEWSHKPGTNPVTNLDEDNKKIYIPHFSNRDYSDGVEDDHAINYSDFCGYYCIPSKSYSGTNSV